MKTLLFALILLTSCTDFTDENHFEVDPKLLPYVDRFYKEAEQRGLSLQRVNLKVEFGKLPEFIAGKFYHESMTVKIDSSKSSWKMQPEALVFHELGHALLNRLHDNKRLANGMLESIMNFDSLPSYYKANALSSLPNTREYYLDELFSKSHN
jgi:hypothetical protein